MRGAGGAEMRADEAPGRLARGCLPPAHGSRQLVRAMRPPVMLGNDDFGCFEIHSVLFSLLKHNQGSHSEPC